MPDEPLSMLELESLETKVRGRILRALADLPNDKSRARVVKYTNELFQATVAETPLFNES